MYTAVLAIIKGNIEPIDVLSVRELKPLPRADHGQGDPDSRRFTVGPILSFAHSCVGYGFVGDILQGTCRPDAVRRHNRRATPGVRSLCADIEAHRWMGKPKTLFCGAKKLLSPVQTRAAQLYWRKEPRGTVASLVSCYAALACSGRQGTAGPDVPLAGGQVELEDDNVVNLSEWNRQELTNYAAVNVGVNEGRNMSVAPEGAAPRNHQRGLLVDSEALMGDALQGACGRLANCAMG